VLSDQIADTAMSVVVYQMLLLPPPPLLCEIAHRHRFGWLRIFGLLEE